MAYKTSLAALFVLVATSCVTMPRFVQSTDATAPTVTLHGTPANYGIYVKSGQCYSRRIWPHDVMPRIIDSRTIDPKTTSLRVTPNEAIVYSFQSIRPVPSAEPNTLTREFCEGGLAFVPESNHSYNITFRGHDVCDVGISDGTGAPPKKLQIFHSVSEFLAGSGDIALCSE